MVQFGVQSSSAAPAASAAAAAASSSLNIRTCSSQLHSKQSHSTAFHLPSLPLNPFRNTFMGVLLSRFWAKLSGAKEVMVVTRWLSIAPDSSLGSRAYSRPGQCGKDHHPLSLALWRGSFMHSHIHTTLHHTHPSFIFAGGHDHPHHRIQRRNTNTQKLTISSPSQLYI